EQYRDAQPRQPALSSQGNARYRFDWSKRSLPRQVSARPFHGHAADQQQSGIDGKQQPWQLHLAPVPDVAFGRIVVCRKAFSDDIGGGKRNEAHTDRGNGANHTKPRPTQTRPIVRPATAVPIIATTRWSKWRTTTTAYLINRCARDIGRHTDLC